MGRSSGTVLACDGLVSSTGPGWSRATERPGRVSSGDLFIDALKGDQCVYFWDMVGYGQSPAASPLAALPRTVIVPSLATWRFPFALWA